VPAGVFLLPHGFAFDDVLVADLAADFGEDGDGVRSHWHNSVPGHFLVFIHLEVGAGGDFVLFPTRVLGVQEEISPLR